MRGWPVDLAATATIGGRGVVGEARGEWQGFACAVQRSNRGAHWRAEPRAASCRGAGVGRGGDEVPAAHCGAERRVRDWARRGCHKRAAGARNALLATGERRDVLPRTETGQRRGAASLRHGARGVRRGARAHARTRSDQVQGVEPGSGDDFRAIFELNRVWSLYKKCCPNNHVQTLLKVFAQISNGF